MRISQYIPLLRPRFPLPHSPLWEYHSTYHCCVPRLWVCRWCSQRPGPPATILEGCWQRCGCSCQGSRHWCCRWPLGWTEPTQDKGAWSTDCRPCSVLCSLYRHDGKQHTQRNCWQMSKETRIVWNLKWFYWLIQYVRGFCHGSVVL
jgi:hypothetical protein